MRRALLMSLLLTAAPAQADPPEPQVVHVLVALCHEDQIACGDHGLGNPGSLRGNLYWGALYGSKRFLGRPELGYEAVPQSGTVDGVLERAVFRRRLDDDREQLIVLDAIHGSHINDAVKRFFHAATEGESLVVDDGGRERRVRVSAAGYVGHNRLMDGVRLPVPRAGEREPVPSFVLACLSERFFGPSLRDAGSTPLVMTRGYMAPEGYVLDAVLRGLAEGDDRATLRDRTIRAYAKWQRISHADAAVLFE